MQLPTSHTNTDLLLILLHEIARCETTEELLAVLAGSQLHQDCDVITLRSVTIAADNSTLLRLEAVWSKANIEVWREPLTGDEHAFAQLLLISSPEPILISNLADFVLFTDEVRDFYQRQGVVSMYYAPIHRHNETPAMLKVMWHTPQTLTENFRDTIAVLTEVLGLVLKYITTTNHNRYLTERLVELEKRVQESEGEIQTLVHDLKQPLTSILTTTTMLENYLDRFDKTQITTKLQKVIEDITGMNDWITSILLLAQARNADVLWYEAVDVQDALQQVLHNLQSLLMQTQAEVDISNLPKLRVRGEPTWVKHVWTNLISNACKYGGNPPLAVVDGEQVGDMIRFSVTDNGSGIPASQIERLYTPFVRLNRKQSGTGIGLVTVKTLVNKMGGDVGVESSTNGSRFWFTLPPA